MEICAKNPLTLPPCGFLSGQQSCNHFQNSGYIDLSKRRVSPEDIVKCEERYMKSKTVASIMRHVASKLPSHSADTTSPTVAATTETGGKDGKKIKAVQKDGHEEDGLEDASGSGSNEEERLERLYEQVAWPLGKKYGHPYDAFKLALTCVNVPLFQADNPIYINR